MERLERRGEKWYLYKELWRVMTGEQALIESLLLALKICKISNSTWQASTFSQTATSFRIDMTT
jgi:hypothetical protein